MLQNRYSNGAKVLSQNSRCHCVIKINFSLDRRYNCWQKGPYYSDYFYSSAQLVQLQQVKEKQHVTSRLLFLPTSMSGYFAESRLVTQ